MAKLVSTFAEMLEARPAISLHLHTPAHQGRTTVKGLMPAQLFVRDVPYFTRRQLTAFESRLAGLYGTKQTLCLTSGTSQGVEAAVLALARRHRRVYVLRNCHKSVINGLVLSGLEVEFIVPAGAVITPAELEAHLAAAPPGGPSAIIFTYPTFEGWSCDLEACAAVCRRHGLEIVVDESHGSHWPASGALPRSAIRMDVDLVLHSLHKYAGALVQTALIHLPERSRLGGDDIARALDLLETTTISNLLLLSVEKAVDRLFDPAAAAHIERLIAELAGVKRRQHNGDGLIRCHVPDGVPVQDPLKFFLTTEHADPATLARWFYEAGVDHEFNDARGVLFIFSILNTLADLKRFERACRQVKPQLLAAPALLARAPLAMNRPEMARPPREAHFGPLERVPVGAARGRIAAEMIAHCPPGWPVLIPGERVTDWHARTLGKDYLIAVSKL